MARRATVAIVVLTAVVVLVASTPAAGTTPSALGDERSREGNTGGIDTDGPEPSDAMAALSTASNLSLTLQPADRAATFGGGISQAPSVVTTRNVTFDGGDRYRLVVRDVDTGGTASIVPPTDVVWPADRSLSVFFRTPDGTVDPPASIAVEDFHEGLNLTVDGPITTTGIVNQSVALVETPSGDVLARTETKPYVVGYNHTASVTVNDTSVAFSLARDPFPRDANVSLAVYNTSTDPWETDEELVVPLSYERGTDAFVGGFDKSRLTSGNYTYQIRVKHPMGVDFRVEEAAIDGAGTPPIVIDGDGGTDSGNSPPAADFSWIPADPVPGETVTFDALESSDPDGSITSFAWDFDGDTVTDATNVTATHTFESAGNHSVRLTVTDDDGATTTIAKTVSVTTNADDTEAGPPVTVATDTLVAPGAETTLNVTGSNVAEVVVSGDVGNWTVLGTEPDGPSIQVSPSRTETPHTSDRGDTWYYLWLSPSDAHAFNLTLRSPREPGNDTFTVTVDNGTGGTTTERVTIEVAGQVGPDVPGVPNAVSAAVAGPDGSFSRREIAAMARKYVFGQPIGGVELSREIVVSVIRYFFGQ